MTKIIVQSFKGKPISTRANGDWNLTQMCQAHGKQVGDFLRLKTTQDYLAKLGTTTGIPKAELVQVTRGGAHPEQGTWGHRMVAIRLAQWCSDEFAVQFVFWIEELLTTGSVNINLQNVAKCNDTQGFVYLAVIPNGFYKIGMSKKPYKRMASLQTGTPLEITLVHRIFTFNCKALERALHDYYSAYWVRSEWFSLPKQCVLEFPSVANELDAALENICLPTQEL